MTTLLASFASLSSWRSLAECFSSFLQATINLRPPSLTVSTHTPPCLRRLLFLQVPRRSKRPEVALCAIDLFVLPPTLSFPYCALMVSERDSLWQPPAAHSDKYPLPEKSSRAHGCLIALTQSFLESTVIGAIQWRSLLRRALVN